MKLRKLTALAATTALCAPMAMAEDMANEMTLVSWGGAYQQSQVKAYVEPYLAMHPEVTVIWDESSAEATAKMRCAHKLQLRVPIPRKTSCRLSPITRTDQSALRTGASSPRSSYQASTGPLSLSVRGLPLRSSVFPA